MSIKFSWDASAPRLLVTSRACSMLVSNILLIGIVLQSTFVENVDAAQLHLSSLKLNHKSFRVPNANRRDKLLMRRSRKPTSLATEEAATGSSPDGRDLSRDLSDEDQGYAIGVDRRLESHDTPNTT